MKLTSFLSSFSVPSVVCFALLKNRPITQGNTDLFCFEIPSNSVDIFEQLFKSIPIALAQQKSKLFVANVQELAESSV